MNSRLRPPNPPSPDDRPEAAVDRLARLLQPLHTSARLSARRLCRSLADGDDLFHEAVLRALACIDQLRDETRFRPWFYAVLLSVHRARARRAFWRRFVPLLSQTGDGGSQEQNRPLSGVTHSVPVDEETRTQAARLSHALQQLPPEQREAVVLFEVDGFSLDEIATMQRVSLSAVKSRLTRGRQRLRGHYEQLCDTDEQPAAQTIEARLGRAIQSRID